MKLWARVSEWLTDWQGNYTRTSLNNQHVNIKERNIDNLQSVQYPICPSNCPVTHAQSSIQFQPVTVTCCYIFNSQLIDTFLSAQQLSNCGLAHTWGPSYPEQFAPNLWLDGEGTWGGWYRVSMVRVWTREILWVEFLTVPTPNTTHLAQLPDPQ